MNKKNRSIFRRFPPGNPPFFVRKGVAWLRSWLRPSGWLTFTRHTENGAKRTDIDRWEATRSARKSSEHSGMQPKGRSSAVVELASMATRELELPRTTRTLDIEHQFCPSCPSCPGCPIPYRIGKQRSINAALHTYRSLNRDTQTARTARTAGGAD